jgi:SAM-dependent methyltransferase
MANRTPPPGLGCADRTRNRVFSPDDLRRDDFRAVDAEFADLQAREKAVLGKHLCHIFPTRRWEYLWAVCEWGLPAGQVVLDVGCGTSPLPVYLALKGATVHAVDLRAENVAAQRHLAEFHGRRLTASAMDVTGLRYPDATFDRVYATSVLEHLPRADQPRAAAELARVLKPGGLLLLGLDFDEAEGPDGRAALFDRLALYRRVIRPSGLRVEGATSFTVPDWADHRRQMGAIIHQRHTAMGLALRRPARVRTSAPRPFTVGVNLPWLRGRYGNDLAPSPYHPEWGHAFDRAAARRVLEDVAAIGFTAVRFWLFEQSEGLVLDGRHRVLGLRPEFVEHFLVLQDLLREQGLVGYWTLLDGNAVHYGQDPALHRLLDSPDHREAFADQALAPLGRLVDEATCYGIDLMNEPEACLGGTTPSGDLLTWPTVYGLLERCAGAVRGSRPGLPLSCGSGWWGDALIVEDRYEGLGLEFFDYHHYGRAGQLQPAAAVAPAQGCLLGEWSATSRDSPAEPSETVAGLREIERLGYDGVLLWRYGDQGGPASLVERPGNWREAARQLHHYLQDRHRVG